ncbi:MAG TPA: aminoglycoside phosphotransferase family protein [Pyrinomonadaceae bacterium]|nr:aminoglycoside phosphotransferase family protein [Pyrinomonadaceae bacterium]
MDSFAHLPHELVSHVTEGCGDRGVAWLHELPSTIARLGSLWSIRIDAPFPGIEYNFVAPATRDNGENVVIKIHPPWDPIEIFDEAAYLMVRAGDGCVRLLEVDATSRSIMIERLYPGRTLTEMFASDKPAAIGPAIEALQRLLMPVSSAPATAPSVDEWFRNFERYGDTDFPHDYAEKAFAIYRELSRQQERVGYLHGDFHPANVVDSVRGPYLMIDPKGIIGHLGYEIACFLNNYHWWHEDERNVRPILAKAVAQFSAAFNIPEVELRQWAYAQMVIGAWWNYADMPALYDGNVVNADIWDV